MTPEQMAALHARAFAGQGRAWSAAEFEELIGSPHAILAAGPHGFALGRVTVDDAELLTIATDPAHRRAGVARTVLAALEEQAAARGAERILLEVAEDNAPAIALYRTAGFLEISRRKGYYAVPGGGRTDALIFAKPLRGKP